MCSAFAIFISNPAKKKKDRCGTERGGWDRLGLARLRPVYETCDESDEILRFNVIRFLKQPQNNTMKQRSENKSNKVSFRSVARLGVITSDFIRKN